VGVSFTAFRSGYTLQVLIRYAHCGLFASIPHADTRVYTRYVPALGMQSNGKMFAKGGIK